jgi:hypothetical protein
MPRSFSKLLSCAHRTPQVTVMMSAMVSKVDHIVTSRGASVIEASCPEVHMIDAPLVQNYQNE